MSEKINYLVGRIIASTKRKIRNLSIVDIANDIIELKKQLGSIGEVATAVGISTGMLNQFISVFKLPADVINLVHNREIDSVALVFTLSKFNSNDIKQLVEPIIVGKITSQDLKALLPFRNQHRSQDILDLLETLNSSKNIKVAVLRMPIKIVGNTNNIEDSIKSLIGNENFFSAELNKEFLDIKISKAGEKILRSAAKENRISLLQLILRLIKYDQ